MDQFTAALAETLKQTTVPDSKVIKAAVERLDKEFYPNQNALPALVQLVIAGDLAVQQLAAVEARKQVIRTWVQTNDGVKNQIKSEVIKAVFEQPNQKIRHALAKLVAAIAEHDLFDDQWPTLLPTLIERVNDPNTKEPAVFALFCVLETQVEPLLPHVSDFLSLFAGLLADASVPVKTNAVKAMDILAQFIDESAEVNSSLAANFSLTIPAMVQVLGEVLASGDQDNVKEVFNTFNNLLFVDSKIMGDHFNTLVELMLQIAANKDLDDEIRGFALLWLTMTVSMKRSKIVKMGQTITSVAVQIAAEEIDADEELAVEEDENENEESTANSLALRLLSVLASELPPAQACAIILDRAQQLITLQSPFDKRAALLSIGIASAGSPDYFNNFVKKVQPILVAGLSDPEPIVSVSALRCLAQLTTELTENIAQYHRELLPLVMSLVDSSKNAKAYKYACHALDGLIEYMTHDAITEYLEALVHKLFLMLSTANTPGLRTAIISAIGSAAFAAGKAFTPYFEGAIQALEPFIRDMNVATEDEEVEMKAATFENISTMARAVGSEAFSKYATPLLQAAYSALSSEQSRIRESGFVFISNMSKVYGSQFASFLDQIVPSILKCLEQEEFSFAEEVDEDPENEDDGFKVNTGITIEKEIASLALGDLAIGTGAAFAPYVENVLKTLGEQLEESYGMREACVSALWNVAYAMFKAEKGEGYEAPKGVPASSYVSPDVQAIIETVRDTTLSSLEEEFDLSMVACILDSISNAVNSMGAIALVSGPQDTEKLESLCIQLMLVLKKEHPCQAEDEEIQDDEDASEAELFVFDTALEVLVSLSLALGGDFSKIFNSFKDVIVSNTSAKSKLKRVAATGALAEFAVGLKESIAPYYEELLNIFIGRLTSDKSLEVRGNCVYGAGIVIEYAPVDLSGAYPQILQLVFALLSKTDRRAEQDDDELKDVINRSYANLCGCVARMALKHRAAVPLEHVIEPLLGHLPFETDLEENVPIFTLISSLYEEDLPLITSHTQQVVDMFARVFTKEKERVKLIEDLTVGREENLDKLKQFPTPELQEKVVALLRHLDGKFNGAVAANPVLKEVL